MGATAKSGDRAVRIVESRHDGESWLLYKIGNLTAIDSDWVRSVGVAWLFKDGGRWKFAPRITGNTSLFYNAVFFLRLSLPFGVFWSIRGSGSSAKKALWQAGIGWQLNGRLAVLLRFQSDKSSATGVTGPNFGQSGGFEYGTH